MNSKTFDTGDYHKDEEEHSGSLPSLRSMASAQAVTNFFNESDQMLMQADSMSFQDPENPNHNDRSQGKQHKQPKQKQGLRKCPHCKKSFPDFSAVSHHVKVGRPYCCF